MSLGLGNRNERICSKSTPQRRHLLKAHPRDDRDLFKSHGYWFKSHGSGQGWFKSHGSEARGGLISLDSMGLTGAQGKNWRNRHGPRVAFGQMAPAQPSMRVGFEQAADALPNRGLKPRDAYKTNFAVSVVWTPPQHSYL